MGNMVRIENLGDIEQMLGWLESKTQKPNIRFYHYVFHRLYAEGKFEPVNVDTLIKFVSKEGLWSDQLNAETDTTQEILRDRFSRRIRWINKILGRKDSPYSKTVYIKYDRSSSRYQMVADIEQVSNFRHKTSGRRSPEVAVEVMTEDLHQGSPALNAGGELEFSIRPSISGFVHVFHADANDLIDKLFPEHGSNQHLKITRGNDVLFPDAVSDLCTIKRWVIEPMDESKSQQKLLVLVTSENVEVTAQDTHEYFGLSGSNEKSILKETKKLDDLNPSQKLSAVVKYWLKSP